MEKEMVNHKTIAWETVVLLRQKIILPLTGKDPFVSFEPSEIGIIRGMVHGVVNVLFIKLSSLVPVEELEKEEPIKEGSRNDIISMLVDIIDDFQSVMIDFIKHDKDVNKEKLLTAMFDTVDHKKQLVNYAIAHSDVLCDIIKNYSCNYEENEDEKKIV